MKKIIATFVIGLLLAFTVIAAPAETNTGAGNTVSESSHNEMLSQRQRRNRWRKMVRKNRRHNMRNNRHNNRRHDRRDNRRGRRDGRRNN